MACLHPIPRTIFDYRLQKNVSIQVPCGHCLDCIRAFRRGWEFRIRKTAERQKNGFIYDTLTIRPDAMPFLDYSEIKDSGAWVIPAEYFSDGIERIESISDENLRLLEHYDFKLPYFPKSFVSHWIKCGRERYKKSTGKRLKMRYAIVQEYGPKYSRTHFHCMFFDISLEDYAKYFAEPWRERFGFTKTKHILSVKDAGCVSSYLTKYFLKGDVDSPLVKAGFLPKAGRLLSHGIGIEYLSDSRCNIAGFLGLPANLVRFALDTTVDSPDKVLVQNLCSMIDLALSDLPEDCLFHLMDRVSTAYIDSYPLSLPRYYKDKLFNANKKSCFYEILSHHIRNYADAHRMEKLCEFVAFQTSFSAEKVRHLFEVHILSYAYWLARFEAYKRRLVLAKQSSKRRIEENIFSRFLRLPKQNPLEQ